MMSQLIEHDMLAFFLEIFTPTTPVQNFNPLTLKTKERNTGRNTDQGWART